MLSRFPLAMITVMPSSATLRAMLVFVSKKMNLNKTFVAVQDASRNMLALSDKEINQILLAVADAAINKTDFILSENQKDLERMPSSDPKYDRLKLTKSRLQDIAADIRNVAALPSPLGKVLKENVLPNGLKIKRVSVPFGVIGIIYEARPNVSFDVFSLCRAELSNLHNRWHAVVRQSPLCRQEAVPRYVYLR